MCAVMGVLRYSSKERFMSPSAFFSIFLIICTKCSLWPLDWGNPGLDVDCFIPQASANCQNFWAAEWHIVRHQLLWYAVSGKHFLHLSNDGQCCLVFDLNDFWEFAEVINY